MIRVKRVIRESNYYYHSPAPKRLLYIDHLPFKGFKSRKLPLVHHISRSRVNGCGSYLGDPPSSKGIDNLLPLRNLNTAISLLEKGSCYFHLDIPYSSLEEIIFAVGRATADVSIRAT